MDRGFRWKARLCGEEIGRPGSNTLKVSHIYRQMLKESGVEAEVLGLHTLPGDLLQNILDGTKNAALEEIEKKYIVPNRTFIFVAPEYRT